MSKERGSHEGENLRDRVRGGKSLTLVPLVVSRVNSSNVIKWNSEPEKCYPTKRTIGSLTIVIRTERYSTSTLYKTFSIQQNQKALRAFLKGLLNIQKIYSVINSLAAPPNISRESPALISGLSAFIRSQRSIYPAISTLQSVFALSPESILSTAFEASL